MGVVGLRGWCSSKVCRPNEEERKRETERCSSRVLKKLARMPRAGHETCVTGNVRQVHVQVTHNTEIPSELRWDLGPFLDF